MQPCRGSKPDPSEQAITPMKHTLIAATVLATALSGCSQIPKLTPSELDEASAPLVCTSKDQCDFVWRKAQLWIVENSAFAIRTATDVVVETYQPTDWSLKWGYRVTRDPLKNGTERIWFAAGCGPKALCEAQPMRQTLEFKRAMRQHLTD